MRKTYGRFSMHLCPEKIRKVAEERIGKSFTQRFSETKPMQTERWQSWWATVTFFLTFVLSYERMKLKIREDVITLLMLPRAECGSAVGRALSPLKTNEKGRKCLRVCEHDGQNPGGVRLPCQGLLYVLDKRKNHAIILNTTE